MPVARPARGVIDVVLEDRATGLLVATEVHSDLRRLEQQIRWSRDKAASLGSSSLVRRGIEPPVSTLLVLRSTATMRRLARDFEATLTAAYPARTVDAFASLQDGQQWPGSAVIWIRIDGDRVRVLAGPPRNVGLGRGLP